MVNGKLPEGWRWTTLNDIALINSRDVAIRYLPDDLPVTFVPMASVDGEQGIIARPIERPLKEVRKGFTPFSEGDVIFAKITPCMENGKAAIAQKLENGRGFGSTEFHVLRPKENVTSKWLYHFIRQESFRTDAKAHFAGTAGQLRVPSSFLVNYPIPLPPLPSQQCIVAKIEELFTQLDAGVAALKRARAALKRYKASVLKAACEGRLVPQDPDDEPAEEMLRRLGKKPLEADGLPELPQGWCWTKIGDIAQHRLGKMLDKEKNKGELRPYIRNINVRWFTFDLTDIQHLRVMNSELDSISINKGDLVVCEGGEPGRAAVWNRDDPMVIQKALHRVRPFEEVSPLYLSFCLAADANIGHLEKYFTGSTIKHFTGESLHFYIFPLPPFAEQRYIVSEVERRLSVVQEVEAVVEAGLKRAARLRQAILKRAFEGRLTTSTP